MKLNEEFWKRQRVFITGHTGFKGAWLSKWLSKIGVSQTGLSLPPDTSGLFYKSLEVPGLTSLYGDIRNRDTVVQAVKEANPTILIHMAAQPLVRRSYIEPLDTFDTNVMGTANVLDAALKAAPELNAVLAITTDKVYRNNNLGHCFTESDVLGGHDPYSSSKVCSEEVINSYRVSYFNSLQVPLITARAGNVIGGGDLSEDRLIPDILRAIESKTKLKLRYPNSTRPWQHVLDPLCGYLKYIEYACLSSNEPPPALNFAPIDSRSLTVREVVSLMERLTGSADLWELDNDVQFEEMILLSLDASKAAEILDWKPMLSAVESVEWTASFFNRNLEGKSLDLLATEQINEFEARMAR